MVAAEAAEEEAAGAAVVFREEVAVVRAAASLAVEAVDALLPCRGHLHAHRQLTGQLAVEGTLRVVQVMVICRGPVLASVIVPVVAQSQIVQAQVAPERVRVLVLEHALVLEHGLVLETLQVADGRRAVICRIF